MRRKRLAALLFCGAVLLVSPRPLWAAQELAIGEQFQIPVQPGIRFSVGNPEVISVRLNPGEAAQPSLLVRAKAQGYSDLLLLGQGKEQRWEFKVIPKRQAAAKKEIGATLGHIPGVKILTRGTNFVLQGQVQNLGDFNLISSFLRQSTGHKYINNTQLSAAAKLQAARLIQDKLRAAGLEELQLEWSGNQAWLRGMVFSQEEKLQAETIVKSVVESGPSSLKIGFEAKDILRFRVQILEVVRSNNQKTGMQWSEEIPGIIEMHQKLLKGNINIGASLRMLAQTGQLRILSKPEIALNSQGVAELRAGGEIPISLKSEHSASVQWKPYGLTLRLEVPGTQRNLARTNVLVEISTLDHANSLEGIPATRVNRLETQLDLSLGKTTFLSGLTQDSFGESTSGITFLEKIPLLGALFRSRDFRENRSELVIAMTALRDRGGR